MADKRIYELTTRSAVDTDDYIAVDDQTNGTGKISVGDLIDAIVDAIPTWNGGSY